MVAFQSPYPHRCAGPLGKLRLDLARDFTATKVAGTWFPYGRDLTREVPHLVDEFPRERGRIDRLVYAPRDWDVVAESVFTGRGRMKIGFLSPDHRGGQVLVRLADAGIVTLAVVFWKPSQVVNGAAAPEDRAQ